MKFFKIIILIVCMVFAPLSLQAQDVIELDTTTIKGNTELPKYMYVVPWQDRASKTKDEQKLVLHNLYSDLFDPLMAEHISAEDFSLVETTIKK